MALFKKTFVLGKNGNKGFLTIISVGSSLGIKVSLNGNPPYLVGVKIGTRPVITEQMTKNKGEYNYPDFDIDRSESVGIAVFKDGELYCEGGSGYLGRAEVYGGSALAVSANEEPLEEAELQNKEETARADPSSVPEEGKVGEADEESLSYVTRGRGGENYYANIRERLDELFVVNPTEKLLERAIENSRWVRVTYDEDGYYVVGKIYEDGSVKYVGYGVPGRADVSPPREAEAIFRWFPLGGMSSFEGYWLLYQNAENGEITDKA